MLRFLASLGRLARRPFRFGFGFGLLLSLLATSSAQAQDSTLARLAHRYQYSMTLANQEFAGAGWDRLRQDLRQSQLVLLGEEHGIAEIPAFAAAVARAFKPAVYVAEIDQYQAQDLTRLADQPGLPVAFNHQHPMGLSFYSYAEEFELARALRAQHVPILGLDQVSMLSAGRFLGRLAEQVKNPLTKALLQRRAAGYQAHDRATMQHGGNDWSIYQGPAALDSLRALVRAEGPVARQMVRDFAASSEIYRLTETDGRRSHQTRVNLMKRNLLQSLPAYQPAGQPLPRMLFKFGAAHLARGISEQNGAYDVGNLALNLADAHDQQSLHVFVVGQQGTQINGFNPDDFSKNAETYSATDDLKPFIAPAGSTAWQVFDLRPLRRAVLSDKLKVASKDLEITLLGYDYLVVIPQTTASHNF